MSALDDFPHTKPVGSDAEMFIQWKGTDLCLDFYCPCGAHGHFDGMFAYYLRCPKCEAVYEMGTQVIARKTEVPEDRAEMVETLDVDDEE